jgi:hypothetical protein
MPAVVVTPVTRGTGARPSVRRPVTRTPRRTGTPAAVAAVASAASSTGRRAVTVSNRASPSRLSPRSSSGRLVSELTRAAPAASTASAASGRSARTSAHHRGNR